MVKNSSVSFWLDVNIEELSRRLKSSKKRPLLNKKNLNETIQKIYIERKKLIMRLISELNAIFKNQKS